MLLLLALLLAVPVLPWICMGEAAEAEGLPDAKARGCLSPPTGTGRPDRWYDLDVGGFGGGFDL